MNVRHILPSYVLSLDDEPFCPNQRVIDLTNREQALPELDVLMTADLIFIDATEDAEGAEKKGSSERTTDQTANER